MDEPGRIPDAPATTIVVVPRETHSTTVATVERLLRTTPHPVRLVVVDGGSPRHVQRRLLRLARDHDLTLLRRDALVTPVEARNLALPHVHTELVAFVDNDTEVTQGWLEQLLRCMRDVGADVVIPATLQRSRRGSVVHFAGGVCHLVEEDGSRRLFDHNAYIGEPVAVVATLDRAPTECLEFHCALARTDAMRAVAPFDEALLAVRDDSDLALRLQGLGRTAWIEPATTVVYPFPKRLRFGDLGYFRARWSDDWSEPGYRHFNEKWDLDDLALDDVYRRGHREHRMRAARWARPDDGWRLHLWRGRRRVARGFDRVLTPIAVRRANHRRAANPAGRIVHAATWDAPSATGARTGA
jgi:cellulose synthase/poly-beta-1,6-N-acetylglucosamine synthase-like glycosyltransferase